MSDPRADLANAIGLYQSLNELATSDPDFTDAKRVAYDDLKKTAKAYVAALTNLEG